MAGRSSKILQLKITLRHAKPPIWRRIQVPGYYTFWDLHVAIQDSMGWYDCHLHDFEVFNPKKRRLELIGIPDDEFPSGAETLPSWEIPVVRLLSSSNPGATYTYDFGDNWEHKIVLEKVFPREEEIEYPRCVAGRRNCPPENCGGTWGYREFLEAISDPNHPGHESMVEWIGEDFDPNAFDPRAVLFDDPKERLKITLGTR